jgi:hypothetical protein
MRRPGGTRADFAAAALTSRDTVAATAAGTRDSRLPFFATNSNRERTL